MAAQLAKDRGFTALELLIVIAISAMLVAMAAPSFSELRRSAGISTSANQLLWALHYARSTAILRNVPAVVCLSADGATCITSAGATGAGWLVFLEQQRSSPVQLNGADELLRSITLPTQLTVQGTRAAVTFWPTARAGTTSTFKLCDAHGDPRGKAVVVSQTGRPRVADGDAPC
jgi:type IV fimbrial biogenesis protein FimT